VGATFGFATPVSASIFSTTVANCTTALNGSTITVPSGTTILSIRFTSCLATTPAADNTQSPTNPNFVLSNTANPVQPGNVTNTSPPDFRVTGQLELNVTTGNPAQIGGMKGGGPGAIVDGVYTVYFGYFQAAAPTTYNGSFTIDVGGSGGGGDSSTEAVPAPTFEIALTPTDGTTCVNSKQAATGGTWLTLPGANDCTPPATKAGATLLGWSTTPDFPLDIAKRQVANGWGTYEIFNDAGRITAVFIPAGRATFLSGTNTLYAIWNN
jgi:hypothetical protein